MRTKKYILIVLSLLCTIIAKAQPIDTAKFQIDYNPIISNFNKLNLGEFIKDTARKNVDFDYYIMPQRLDLTFAPSQVKAAKLPADVMKRLYRNFIRVGFGYPVTPLAQISIHNFDNRKHSYGINFHHYSSWGPQVGTKLKKYAYAPTSDTRIHLFFNHFFRKQTLYSSIDYNHELAHLYGFNKDNGYDDYYYGKSFRDTLNNSFHHLHAQVGLRSNYVLEDRHLKQDVRIDYNFLYTHKKNMENHIGLTSYFSYDERFLKLSGSQNYRIDLNFDYFNDQLGNSIIDSMPSKNIANSFLLELKPSVNFTIKEYHILLGVGLPFANSTSYQKALFPIYPIAELQLGLVPQIMSIYVGIDGKTELNSLQNLLYENAYLKPNLDTLKFSRTQISIYGGIKGNLVRKLNYRISARYSHTKDLALFRLDTNALLKNQFDVVYTDADILNVCANINWQVLDHLYLNLDANYWGYYNLSNTEHAWYKPTYEISFGGNYYYKDKFIFDLNLALAFDRWAYIPYENSNYVIAKMKPILNFGFGFEYLINKELSAFIRVDNLACQYYSKYYDFPSFGINALIGVTYSFGDESLKKVKTPKK